MAMGTLHWIWLALQFLVGYNLILPLLLYIAYQFAKTAEPLSVAGDHAPDYAIIITAYEQVDTVSAAVASALQLRYQHFMVYVVADKCDVSGLVFADERVVVLRPPEPLNGNVRSHFYAVDHFIRPHTHLLILDSDNLIHSGCLDELNVFFAAGYEAVQGVRKPKNLDSTYACLDAARDVYYHFYDGEVLFGLGSSATLTGSGMAFTTRIYEACLRRLAINGAGFDKVLQMEIVRRGRRIAFAGSAIVYDEKTSRADQLVKQRARWINTWFRYSGYGFTLLGLGLKNRSINQALFGLVLLRPPLFLFLLASTGFLASNLLLVSPLALAWLAGIACFIVGFMLAIYSQVPDPRIVASLRRAPFFMYYQVLSLVRARNANRISIATRHYSSKTIDELD